MNYQKLSIGLGLVVAFLAGCMLRDTLVVPPAHAGTNPTRWEYVCTEGSERITASSNRLGAEGWELAAAAGAGWGSGITAGQTMIWCFKRPLG